MFAQLRASAWKYAAIACAVLAVAAFVTCVMFQFRLLASNARADASERRAETLQGELREAKAAAERDVVSDVATADARESGEQRQAESTERVKRAKAIADEPRPPVPVVCPAPDARLHVELEAGSDRLRTTEDRLRHLRTAGE